MTSVEQPYASRPMARLVLQMARTLRVLILLACAACASGRPSSGPATGLMRSEWPIAVAAIGAVIQWARPPAPAVCVESLGKLDRRTAAKLLPVLRAPIPVAPGDACPRTYTPPPVLTVGVQHPVRPAGYVDPYHVRLIDIWRPGRDSAQARLQLLQGSGGRDYTCALHRKADVWMAMCKVTSNWVS